MRLRQGKDLACHRQIAEALDGGVYFARFCHGREHGMNEHMSGLIRWDFPKGMDFDQVIG